MSTNGQNSLECAPLGEPSSHFLITPTGEIADAVELPPDEDFMGAVIVDFEVTHSSGNTRLMVDNIFIPPQDEILLPTKRTLLTLHDALVDPIQSLPEDTAQFKLAKETRWDACDYLQGIRRQRLGGVAVYKNVTGLFYSRQLPELTRKTVRTIRRAIDWSGTDHDKEKAMLREVMDFKTGSISEQDTSAVMRLIVCCGIARSQAFREKLGFREETQPAQQHGDVEQASEVVNAA